MSLKINLVGVPHAVYAYEKDGELVQDLEPAEIAWKQMDEAKARGAKSVAVECPPERLRLLEEYWKMVEFGVPKQYSPPKGLTPELREELKLITKEMKKYKKDKKFRTFFMLKALKDDYRFFFHIIRHGKKHGLALLPLGQEADYKKFVALRERARKADGEHGSNHPITKGHKNEWLSYVVDDYEIQLWKDLKKYVREGKRPGALIVGTVHTPGFTDRLRQRNLLNHVEEHILGRKKVYEEVMQARLKMLAEKRGLRERLVKGLSAAAAAKNQRDAVRKQSRQKPK